MAHAYCPNGHEMWNGDGKPVVYAFRVGFFRDFVKKHPDAVLGSWEYPELYDCVDDISGEDLDCWYCDECKGLVVFNDAGGERYDFKRMETIPDIAINDLDGWEDYIALQSREFEDFMDFYEGKNPLEAIMQYDFVYHYKVSQDKKNIYALDREGHIAFGYFRSGYIRFSKDLDLHSGQYADAKEGNAIDVRWSNGRCVQNSRTYA